MDIGEIWAEKSDGVFWFGEIRSAKCGFWMGKGEKVRGYIRGWGEACGVGVRRKTYLGLKNIDVYALGRIWAGHNILLFDCPRIREAFAEINRQAPEPKGTIDSLPLLTQKFGRRAGDMKMATLATYFGLGKQTHRKNMEFYDFSDDYSYRICVSASDRVLQQR